MFAIAAIVCFVVAGLAGFGAITTAHILGWVAFGLACLAAHLLVPFYPWRH